MAAIYKQTNPVRVTNTRLVALPGSGGGQPVYPDSVDISFTAVVWDDKTVTLKAAGTVYDSYVLVADYPMLLVANKSSFNFSQSASGVTYPGTGRVLDNQTVRVAGSGHGTFTWNINTEKYIGTVDEFGANGSAGAVWVGGTGNYSVNSPIYPSPFKISIPGFVEIIEELNAWFPWSRYSGEVEQAFASCNRTPAGYVQRYAGQWEDLKNSVDTTSVSYWDGTHWETCPRIGVGA